MPSTERAYDRITDVPPSYSPTFFAPGSIQLISSIAPTDFLGPSSSNPHGANYHFIYGAADGEVTGGPGSDIEDVLVAAEIDSLAQNLAHDLQRGADDGVVA